MVLYYVMLYMKQVALKAKCANVWKMVLQLEGQTNSPRNTSACKSTQILGYYSDFICSDKIHYKMYLILLLSLKVKS